MPARGALPGHAPRKAAKKVAKKAAKKVAKKAGKKAAKSPGHEQRRTYEHLHRLQILAHSLPESTLAQVETLSQYAQAAYRVRQGRAAADLLRAAEHLAFGALAPATGESRPAEELMQALANEYEHLSDRATAGWETSSDTAARALKAIFRYLRTEAKTAWKGGAYHRALEFARGADALAHADAGQLRLEASAGRGRKALPEELEG